MKSTQSVLILKGFESQFDELIDSIKRYCEYVYMVSTMDEAIKYLSKKGSPLILMDLIFEGSEATDFIEHTRQLGLVDNSLIIIFSGKRENYVEIAALNAGAADFMVKPVNKHVFASRLKSWMRQQSMIQNDGTLKFDSSNGVILDYEKFLAIVDQRPIELQRKEFEIMALLISNPRKVFSREEIINNVWSHRDHVNTRTIDVHIRNLRVKLGPHPIKTYKGVGYCYQEM